ncbi:MAG: right-handed parallel beta-helix repeat-containing protein [Planctomycetota bacterium]
MHQIDEYHKKYRRAWHPAELYVGLDGDCKWSGTIPDPNGHGSNGPCDDLMRLRDRLRAHPAAGPVTVFLRGGTYYLDEPWEFGPEDTTPLIVCARPGERVIISGGRVLTGWQEGTHKGQRAWVLDLDRPLADHHQLFVDGRRAERPSLPEDGTWRMEHVPQTPRDGFMVGTPQDRFTAAAGHFDPEWERMDHIDVVAYHFWNEERMPVASYDPDTREVRCTRTSMWPLKDDAEPAYARYRLENVYAALERPGQWFYDRDAQRVIYLPLQDQQLATTTVVSPVHTQLLRITGSADRPAGHLTFRDLQFAHSHFVQPGDRAGYEQAAADTDAAVELRHARHCRFEHCDFTHLGNYAIELGAGCRGDVVAGCRFSDLAVGGVKLVGVDERSDQRERSDDHQVIDNEITDGGRLTASGVGILAIHTSGNELSHNHIHHLEYSGISCGWTWGNGPSPTHDNRIEANHIHHLGTGLLNDMGGVYTLGPQPGTSISHNRIHDIRMHSYGGWAMYCDEGSSYITVEYNTCYRTDSEVFQLHYGRENVLQYNCFAFSRLGQVSQTVFEDHRSFSFRHNLVITDDRPIFAARDGEDLATAPFQAESNCYFDPGGAGIFSANQDRDSEGLARITRRYELDEMRSHGHDRGSIVADPRCADLDQDDFSLPADSPAWAVGYRVSDRAPGPRCTPGITGSAL